MMDEPDRGEGNQMPKGATSGDAASSAIPRPSSFILDAEVRREIERCLARYPTKQAAVLPALHVVNGRLGYVPMPAVVEVAQLLGLAPAQVQDTLSFYGFFKQDKPLGRHRLWVCRSISCAAREGEELLGHLCGKLGIRPGETTPDGRVTLEFAECLGACEQAPAILVDDVLHGDMTKEKVDGLLAELTR
jgi:NADH-quinone oxidoreductase subunit E